MFICMNCREQVPAGIAPRRIVTEVRLKVYRHIKTQKPRKASKFQPTTEEQSKPKELPPSYGWEIVREIHACPACAVVVPQAKPPDRTIP